MLTRQRETDERRLWLYIPTSKLFETRVWRRRWEVLVGGPLKRHWVERPPPSGEKEGMQILSVGPRIQLLCQVRSMEGN